MDKDLIIAARPKDGFRRAGIHHPPSPVRHRAGTFTPDQVEALKAEPNLLVIEQDPAPVPDEEGGEDGAKGAAPAKPKRPKPDPGAPPAS